MRPVYGRACWSALLLLLTLFGVTTADAQQTARKSTIEERIATIQKMRLIGKPDRSYRLPGQKFPGERLASSVAAAGGKITGTITGIDDIEATKPYMLVYPADDTTNEG